MGQEGAGTSEGRPARAPLLMPSSCQCRTCGQKHWQHVKGHWKIPHLSLLAPWLRAEVCKPAFVYQTSLPYSLTPPLFLVTAGRERVFAGGGPRPGPALSDLCSSVRQRSAQEPQNFTPQSILKPCHCLLAAIRGVGDKKGTHIWPVFSHTRSLRLPGSGKVAAIEHLMIRWGLDGICAGERQQEPRDTQPLTKSSWERRWMS